MCKFYKLDIWGKKFIKKKKKKKTRATWKKIKEHVYLVKRKKNTDRITKAKM